MTGFRAELLRWVGFLLPIALWFVYCEIRDAARARRRRREAEAARAEAERARRDMIADAENAWRSP